MALTDMQIKKLKPKENRFLVTDEKGLVLRVAPSGSKTFYFRYMLKGKPRIMTLGKYPSMSLLDARARLKVERDRIDTGIDPLDAKRKIELNTFTDLFDEFWEKELSAQPAGKERRRLIDKDVLPEWADRPLASITRRDAVLLLDKVKGRGATVTANRLLGVLVRVFNFACERGVLDFSPLSGMRRSKEKPRTRALTDAEIKLVWNNLNTELSDHIPRGILLNQNNIDIYCMTKLALKTILLTGQRPIEVVTMEWSHLEKDFWIIPAALTKTRTENRVPILPMFADVLKQAKQYGSGKKYVFTSSQSNKNHIDRLTLSNAIRRHREQMGIKERFTPHDLRRSMRTKLAELGVNDIIAEQVLGHKLSGIVGVYNRYQYDAEKRQALALWEKRLSEIIQPAPPDKNVIPFKGARHG